MTTIMNNCRGRISARGARITGTIILACAALFTSGCDVHGASDAGTLSTLTVSPNPRTLAINATQQFTAVGADFSGAPVSIETTWSVVAGGGTISPTGLFTAGSTTGTFASTVQATSGGMSNRATVIVTAGPLATIVITPTPVSLAIGATQQFIATGRDAGGNVVAINPTWLVESNGGAINATTGLFTAGTVPGTFANTVRAVANGISGVATVSVVAGPLATITVTPNPDTTVTNGVKQFVAIGRDASGNIVTFVPTWSVTNGGGAIGVSGLFTAGTVAGTYLNTVRATSGTVFGVATETVLAAALASIVITPNPASLTVGGTQQFVATGRDATGNTVVFTPTWSIVNGGGTIVSTSGLFTAANLPGTYTNTVRASSGGISATATVTLVIGPLATIDVAPNPDTTLANGTKQFTAVGRDAVGNTVAITPVWSVANGGGAIGTNSGIFTAGNAAGTFVATIRATSGNIFGSATEVVILPQVLATITVTPNPSSVTVNGTQQFTAVGRDVNGAVMTITPVWSIVNGGGSIGANSGAFTAGTLVGTFSNTVRASVGSVFGAATVNVTPGALASIVVLPNPVTLLQNSTQQFTAVGRDASNNLVSLSAVWSVVNGGGIINSASGLFTAGNVGGTYANTVRATNGAISASATVTVTTSPIVPPFLDLGGAAANGIMAGTAVTCVTGGIINANVSISPGSTITGFGPCIITGVQHLADAVALQAQIDLTNAYNTLAGLPCPPANAIVANLGGTTKTAGVYCTASSIGVSGTLTLDGGGDPNAVFVFQAGTSLITAGNIVLINGAQAKNVYWQVGTSATLGTGSQWQGNILALTSITLVDNATLFGRALARNGAVSLGTNNIITLP